MSLSSLKGGAVSVCVREAAAAGRASSKAGNVSYVVPQCLFRHHDRRTQGEQRPFFHICSYVGLRSVHHSKAVQPATPSGNCKLLSSRPKAGQYFTRLQGQARHSSDIWRMN
jgi:hypothetical protein